MLITLSLISAPRKIASEIPSTVVLVFFIGERSRIGLFGTDKFSFCVCLLFGAVVIVADGGLGVDCTVLVAAGEIVKSGSLLFITDVIWSLINQI